jgi:hypothetical protein
MPATDGNLAGDQQRTFPFTVVDGLQQIAALLGVQRLGTPAVDDEQAACAPGPSSGVPAVSHHERRRGRRTSVVLDSRARRSHHGTPCGPARRPTRICPRGRTADQHVAAVADAAAGRECLELAAVKPVWRAQIGVLDHCVLSQPSGAYWSDSGINNLRPRLGVRFPRWTNWTWKPN